MNALTPALVRTTIMEPAFDLVLPRRFYAEPALVECLTIGKTESDFRLRVQDIGGGRAGPARGFWQFERRGGVVGVMTHATTKAYAQAACAIRGVPFDSTAIHQRLAEDDILAFCFARLLLWTDPKGLPPATDAEGLFDYYLRNWRPGAYQRDPAGVRARFMRSHAWAMAA